MSGECVITVVGNLVDDVELRFVPSGAAVANFRVASTPRRFNRDTNAWEDDKDGSLFLSCSIWRQAAENAAESLAKGMRVIVQGRLKQRSYETAQGEKRTVVELEVDELGVSLKNATAKVEKTGGRAEAYGAARQASSSQSGASRDPWTDVPGGNRPGGWADQGQAQGAQAGGWGQGAGVGGDEPPF